MMIKSFNLCKTFFKALSNKTRFDIINILNERPMSVSDICRKTGFEQSRVSHNLKGLEQCGFVVCECKGKIHLYRIDKNFLRALRNMEGYLSANKDKLKRCSIR